MHLRSRALLNAVWYKDASYNSRHLNKKIYIYIFSKKYSGSILVSILNACQSRLSCSYIHK